MSFGEQLQMLRRGSGLTQEEFAQQLQVSRQAVSKWERGENLPDVTLIVPLASYFGITTDELLGVSEEVKRAKIQKWYDDYKPYVWRMTKETAQARFDNLLALMEEYEDYRFLLCEPPILERLKELYPDATLIYIAPPSLEVLEKRLRDRNDTPEDQIKVRSERAAWEDSQKDKYDHIVINDVLEEAVAQVLRIMDQRAK